MMERRSFLAAMMAAAAGPSIVRAGSLMRIAPARVAPPVKAPPLAQAGVVAIVGGSLMVGQIFTLAGELNPDGRVKKLIVTSTAGSVVQVAPV